METGVRVCTVAFNMEVLKVFNMEPGVLTAHQTCRAGRIKNLCHIKY
jgi:hypothetical protein